MIKLDQYKNAFVGILGLGKTGTSAAIAFKNAQSSLILWDDEELQRKNFITNFSSSEEFINSSLVQSITGPDNELWKKLDILVKSPSIKEDHPLLMLAKKLNIKIITDIELIYQHCSAAIYIGITGSNGKSTTTSLSAHILSKLGIKTQMGGNIGIPVLNLDPLENDGSYVFELSSFQLENINKVKFNIAVLLNITNDHIDYHKNLENYINAKKKIFFNQDKNNIAIIGIDSKLSKNVYEELKTSIKSKIIPISTDKILDHGVSFINDKIYYNIDSDCHVFHIGELEYLKGKHNKENIAAAFSIAMHYKNDPRKITEHIKSFTGLPHRIQIVGKINNITFINDSKATNADSTSKALSSFENIYWIAGGKSKPGGINEIIEYFPKIKHAFFIGSAEEEFAEIAAKNNLAYSKSSTLEKAFKAAYEMAKNDSDLSNVLLSPACASIDQFQNFEERGNLFCKYVKDLLHQ